MHNITRHPRGVAIGGARSGATTASLMAIMTASFNPTSATQVLLGFLPKGARVIDVRSFGGATGGTNPTVDIGTLADDDGLANELDADNNSSAFAAGTLGVLANTRFTDTATAVYGKVGASAAGGGTTTVHIHYVVEEH